MLPNAQDWYRINVVVLTLNASKLMKLTEFALLHVGRI